MASKLRNLSCYLSRALLICTLSCFLSLPLNSHSTPRYQRSGSVGAARDINLLFDEELQQAQSKMKWHGERLTEDTIYAAALTGKSWYSGWEGHRLFSLSMESAAKKIDSNKTYLILNDAEADYELRYNAWQDARRSGRRKEAVVLGLSLLFASGEDINRHDESHLQLLSTAGVDIERICLGILQAPEGLKGFSNFWYSAANILALRANPRLLPFLLHLANSDDAFLRSRAILGLGVVGYQSRPADPPDWARSEFTSPLHEYGLSVGERKLVIKAIVEAARSDRYLVRASAATALGLVAEDESQPILLKLAKDRAYRSSQEISGSRVRLISFPVRAAAAHALERYGIHLYSAGGELSGKALDSAKRGGQDVSKDHHNLRRDPESIVSIEMVKRNE